jgi:hypothetical protein
MLFYMHPTYFDMLCFHFLFEEMFFNFLIDTCLTDYQFSKYLLGCF